MVILTAAPTKNHPQLIMDYFELYYAYLAWCKKDNWANYRDPNHDYMEWNHTLPQYIFGDQPIGQWLTIEQHAIATALQSLAWNRNFLCYWHVQHLPGWLWEMCRPLYSKWVAEHAVGFSPEQRAKGLETQKQNQLGFYNPDFHTFEGQSAAGKIGGTVSRDRKVGIFGMTEEEKLETCSLGGKIGGRSGLNSDPDYLRDRGIKGGNSLHTEKDEEGKSVYAKEIARKSHERKTKEGKSEHAVNMGRKGGARSGKQVWESTIDGFRSNAPTVARHNKRNGWDPNARVRIF